MRPRLTPSSLPIHGGCIPCSIHFLRSPHQPLFIYTPESSTSTEFSSAYVDQAEQVSLRVS